MGIQIKLQAFEGPLDLLLHLIEKNKVDIYDIPIVDITSQYINYIDKMKENNLEIMSEFLVMAATLIKIKSAMLLPDDKKEEEQEQQEDPRQELVERLLEYKMYKLMAEELKYKQVQADKVIFKKPDIPKEVEEFKREIDPKELLSDLTLSKLQDIFKSVIKKQNNRVDPIRSKFGKIEREEISLSDKMIYVENYAKSHKKFSFKNILENNRYKTDIIVTFLSILELIKVGKIKIIQEDIFSDIIVEYKM